MPIPSQSLVLYNMVIAHLAEPPDLAVVQGPAPCPEQWPLLLQALCFKGKQLQGFVLSDGRALVHCKALPELYTQLLTQFEVGSILHVRGARACYLPEQKAYGLDVEAVLSLKEYDQYLQKQAKKRAKRQQRIAAQMMSEGYLPDPQAEAEVAADEAEGALGQEEAQATSSASV